MATFQIAEFTQQGRDTSSNLIPVVSLPAVLVQSVTLGAGSVQSAALGGNTSVVRLTTDGPCCIAAGPNPTATTDSLRLPAGAVEYFAVTPGHKIAVIAGA